MVVNKRKPRNIRFWDFVKKTDSCWFWTGAKQGNGYGQFRIGYGRFASNGVSHKIAYELLVGAVPNGLVLDHLCRNRNCVNPVHLEPVTMKENILRGVGFASENAKKTHCHRGHELSETNLIKRHGRKQRDCKTCASMREKTKRHAS